MGTAINPPANANRKVIIENTEVPYGKARNSE